MSTPVLLDACVLYPVGVRDTLLNMAEAGFFRVLWSDEILAETRRSIVRNVPGLADADLDNTFDAMRQAFPEAMVSGYEHLIEKMTNAAEDCHVLAAAVHGEAVALTTFNLRDFPPEACDPHGIQVISPDGLLVEALEHEPIKGAEVLRAQAARKRRPPMTVHQMLDRLAVCLPTFVEAARPVVD